MKRSEFLALCQTDRDGRRVSTPSGDYAGYVARTRVGYGKAWQATTVAPGGISEWSITRDFDGPEQAEAWLLGEAS